MTTGTLEFSQRSACVPAATILVRNSANAKVDIQFGVSLRDRTGAKLEAGVQGGGLIESGHVAVFPLLLAVNPILRPHWDRRLPASGSLRMTATVAGATNGGTPTHRYRDVQMPQARPAPAEIAVSFVGFVPAVILFLWGLARSGKAMTSIPTTGPPWTPQSWSANLAIGGALLSTLLAISALPAQTYYMARSSYTILNILFAALVALGPLVYGLLKAGGQPQPPAAFRMFAFAAAITLWATVGQLGTAALLLMELKEAGVVAAPSAISAISVVGGVAALVLVYAFRAVSSYLTPPPTGGQTHGGGQPHPPPASPRLWALI